MRRWHLLFGGFVLILALAKEGEAQVTFGPELVLWDLDHLGIGARIDLGLADAFGIEEGWFEHLRGSVNGTYSFGESEGFLEGTANWSAIVLNANAVLPFDRDGVFAPFAGAGINHTRFSSSLSGGPSRGNYSGSASGFNVLGGIEFGLGGLPTFGEVQYSTSGSGFVTVGVGVMFGGGSP